MPIGANYARKKCFTDCTSAYEVNTSKRALEGFKRKYGFMYSAMWSNHVAEETRKQTKCLEACHKMMINQYYPPTTTWSMPLHAPKKQMRDLSDPNKPAMDLTNKYDTIMPHAEAVNRCQRKCERDYGWNPWENSQWRNRDAAEVMKCKLECAGETIKGMKTLDPRTASMSLDPRKHPMNEHAPRPSTNWTTVEIGVGAVAIAGALFLATS